MKPEYPVPASVRCQRPVAHQRVHGALDLRQGAHGLTHLYQRAPCRVLFPDVEAGEPDQAILITTSGGLTGGDRLEIAVAVAPGAALTVSTQAAEKIYRALDEDADCRIETRIVVAGQGWAEWLGQEAILFDGARIRRTLDVELEGTARILAVESMVFGREAMGEALRGGRIFDRWTIRRDGLLLWVDALALDGDIADEMTRPFAFDGARALATILYAGADAADHLALARALIGEQGGATSFDGLLIVRLAGRDVAVMRRTAMRVVAGLRAAAAGLPERMPALWSC
ncbi:MAG TPA: urease accessory protein UreD [Sphingomonas sp.]